MKTDNKQLEISEEMAITLPYVIKIIKELCPAGATYASRVMTLAVDLSDELDSFYTGAFLSDYGCYPFLIVKEYHYEEDCHISDPVIVKSMFDIGSFHEFVDYLSVSERIKADIKKDVLSWYANIGEKLDVVYLDVIQHLIEYFKCLKKQYEYARSETERACNTPIGYSSMVNLECALTLPYLMKRINKFNQKKGAASGRRLLVLKVGSSDDRVIVSCEKCNKK